MTVAVTALQAIKALGHPHRLEAFRMLIRHGGTGVPAGDVADALNVPPSTLSTHLAQLERAGLLKASRRDRHILYAADLAGVKGLLSFLLDECCDGHPELCGHVAQLGPVRHLMANPLSPRSEPGLDRPFRVLILSERNAARGLMAEAVINALGQGRFQAYSAGSAPMGAPHPVALDVLRHKGIATDGLRPKSTARFEGEGAPQFDFIITIVDRALGATAPRWEGRPTTALWNLTDPFARGDSTGNNRSLQTPNYWDLFDQISQRARMFLDLSAEQLRQRSLVTQGLDTRGEPENGSPIMTREAFNVLFLCRGNSARSIMAETILNREGLGRFKAYSAGSAALGTVHPYTLDLLNQLNHSTDGLRSKSWDEFAGDSAPALDFVFTVCDQAAAEVCPVWPGQPMSAHWGVPDPASADGTEAERRFAFSDAYSMLSTRISLFVNLPIQSLDRLSLQKRLDAIGQTSDIAPA